MDIVNSIMCNLALLAFIGIVLWFILRLKKLDNQRRATELGRPTSGDLNHAQEAELVVLNDDAEVLFRVLLSSNKNVVCEDMRTDINMWTTRNGAARYRRMNKPV